MSPRGGSCSSPRDRCGTSWQARTPGIQDGVSDLLGPPYEAVLTVGARLILPPPNSGQGGSMRIVRKRATTSSLGRRLAEQLPRLRRAGAIRVGLHLQLGEDLQQPEPEFPNVAAPCPAPRHSVQTAGNRLYRCVGSFAYYVTTASRLLLLPPALAAFQSSQMWLELIRAITRRRPIPSIRVPSAYFGLMSSVSGARTGRVSIRARLPPCCRDPAPTDGTRRYGADHAGIEHRQRLREVLGQVRVPARFLA